MRSIAAALALLIALPMLAQVQDNSFLLEEATNQEPGVVQHINLLLWDKDSDSWVYSFTQEWPIRSMKHQFSYTIPIGSFDGDTELGDIALNYRYQLFGDDEARVAVAPRLSLIVPTGEESDETGVQFGIPISAKLTERLRAHTNLGATWFSDDVDTTFFAGQSLVFAITPRFDAHFEVLWSGNDDDDQILLSPGIRWAHDLPSGLQIVPGVAYVRGPNDSDAALFYLSFEK